MGPLGSGFGHQLLTRTGSRSFPVGPGRQAAAGLYAPPTSPLPSTVDMTKMHFSSRLATYGSRGSESTDPGRRAMLRTLLRAGGAWTLGVAAHACLPESSSWGQAAGTAPAEQTLPIIDTHQHLWDLKQFSLPWLQGAPEVLARSYLSADFREATAGLNVEQAVYMEVDVRPDQQVDEAEYVIELARSGQHPTRAAVISGRPAEDTFAPYIKRLAASPYIRGVRQVLHAPSAPRGFCLKPEFVASMRLLGELGLSFDLCMRPTELSDGVRLVKLAPETRFIVDHCGNADPKAFGKSADNAPPSHDPQQWRRDMDALSAQPNVICKISGIVARVPQGEWGPELLAPVIHHCLDTFGPERVVFGGDWPVCLLGASYRRWVESLRAVMATRPLQEQRQLFSENARRFYRLT